MFHSRTNGKNDKLKQRREKRWEIDIDVEDERICVLNSSVCYRLCTDMVYVTHSVRESNKRRKCLKGYKGTHNNELFYFSDMLTTTSILWSAMKNRSHTEDLFSFSTIFMRTIVTSSLLAVQRRMSNEDELSGARKWFNWLTIITILTGNIRAVIVERTAIGNDFGLKLKDLSNNFAFVCLHERILYFKNSAVLFPCLFYTSWFSFSSQEAFPAHIFVLNIKRKPFFHVSAAILLNKWRKKPYYMNKCAPS